MRAFTLTEADVSRVIKGLVLDELMRSDPSNRTRIQEQDWAADFSLGTAGADLDPALITQCIDAFCVFFALDRERVALMEPEAPVRDWASAVTDHLSQSLLQLVFRPAGRGKASVTYAHRADSLFQDAAAVASLLQGRRRMISLVSPHSLMGFCVTILVPKLQAIDVIDGRTMVPEDLTQALAFGDVVVATPSVWSYMIREGISAPDNTMGVTFGEVMSRELAADMRRKGIGVLREFYGSTQTGIVGWRDSSTDRYALFDHFDPGDEGLRRHLPVGHAVTVDVMDHLIWEGDRGFTLGGRRDGAVQIGAINVFPDWIAAVISDHDRVARCTVHVAEARNGANRLVADIYLKPGIAPNEAIAREIDRFSRGKLAVPERPQIYHFYTE
ncbi:MAG: hypothetical protein AAFR20_07610 [Pseudomonadota bacterium]